jgi:hypothetical protein
MEDGPNGRWYSLERICEKYSIQLRNEKISQQYQATRYSINTLFLGLE